jgi:hypothetical protein
VLKTPLSTSGHTHPVYSLALLGTQNANSLVSASTDGVVCAWSLDMLARPQETLELVHPAHSKTDEVSITSLGFPLGETATFWCGTEEGNVYAAHRYDRAGAKAGLIHNEVYRGHSGPVTGLDFHPAEGSVDLSDLFLTSGVDWTVRLWRAGGANPARTAAGGATSSQNGGASRLTSSSAGGRSSLSSSRLGSSTSGPPPPGTISPLFTFEEAGDYVYDVRWHPLHPAVFGTVDAAGKFNLWNLNVDTEVRVATLESQECNGTYSPRWHYAGPACFHRRWRHCPASRAEQACVGTDRGSESRGRFFGRQSLRLRDQCRCAPLPLSNPHWLERLRLTLPRFSEQISSRPKKAIGTRCGGRAMPRWPSSSVRTGTDERADYMVHVDSASCCLTFSPSFSFCRSTSHFTQQYLPSVRRF